MLACFDAQNLAPVAAAIRERQPEALIIIAADHDENLAGQRAADKAVTSAGRMAAVALPTVPS
ncbi:phage/plasmid primase-like uncharacterized protein [Mesorhizobium soli]|nr:phage/plasmid primase-like uncharacterized protein [Mesorhizobium soli]